MSIKACIPVIPSANIEKSLRFWVEALGLTMDQEMNVEGKLAGCMVHNEDTWFWINRRAGTPIKPEDYEGIKLYWTPADIHETRERLKQFGFHRRHGVFDPRWPAPRQNIWTGRADLYEILYGPNPTTRNISSLRWSLRCL